MFNSLPRGGGVLDQDNRVMRRLYTVASARNDANITEGNRQASMKKLEKRFK